jgi:hypothetical protein
MPANTPTTRATGSVLLDIGEDTGALVVYTSPSMVGREIEISPTGNAAKRTHTEVLRRTVGTHVLFAGVFAAVRAGEYSIWRDVLTDESVSVLPGQVQELDWQAGLDPDDFRLALPEGSSGTTPVRAAATPLRSMLPRRYAEVGSANANPMGAASLMFTSEGSVAWDQMWTGYCDLAMAGGPRHRATLLEPTGPGEDCASQQAYQHVVHEIERGLRLVTGLETRTSADPGWVGLLCDDAAMARWLVRAIAEENVSVRREERVLYVPAGPTYRLEGEIKNVVTAVAKTFHYWSEHRAERDCDSS